MALPDGLRRVLPDDAAETWEGIAPILPAGLYLVGGTAIAAHLVHRPSRDLDFFFHEGAVDLDGLAERLRGAGPFAVVERTAGTLNGVFSQTRLHFLHADEAGPQRRLEPTRPVAGLEVAGMGDLLAMKLKVIGERGELRDYFDVMTIEKQTGRTVEEGLGLVLARYRVEDPPSLVTRTVRALGYLDDLDEDDLLPARKREIARYWQRRQPEIIEAISRFGLAGASS